MFIEKEKAAREKEAAEQAAIVRTQRLLEADEDESDSESDSDSGADEEEDEVRQALKESMDTDADSAQPTSRKRKKLEKENDDADWGYDADEGLTRQLLSFDIYLKGNVSKASSFFKTAGVQTQRFRMFPYIERKRRVDEYGETVDVGMWLRRGKALEDAENDDIKAAKLQKQTEEEAKVQAKISYSASLTKVVESSSRATSQIHFRRGGGAASMSPALCGYGGVKRRTCCQDDCASGQPPQNGGCL